MPSNESIIVVNPGSTSTKMAYFEGERESFRETIIHDSAVLLSYKDVWGQYDFRLSLAKSWAQKITTKPAAIVGIGGLLRPIPSGPYLINRAMLTDARANLQGAHPSNLGCAIAFDLASFFGCPGFVVDPVSVDEMSSIARYSGHPLIERRSLAHALNIHAMARRAAFEIGKAYEESSFVVAHLGGGISVAPVQYGHIIDVNDASSDGPFSPDRTGGLPLQQFVTLCFSGKYTEQEIRSLVMGKGGLFAYLGTTSSDEIEKRIVAGDEKAQEVFEAMCYQISKEIGAMATVLSGKVDGIVLTGGLAKSSRLTSLIVPRVRYVAKVLIFPGEDEMAAMAQGALRVLRGQIQPKEY